MTKPKEQKTFFQPVNWGDVLRKAQHLGPLEFGAYMYLYAHYWETGRPLPAPRSDDKGGIMPGMEAGFNGPCYRVCKAHTKAEQAVVDSILEEFFDLGPHGYTHQELDAQLQYRWEQHYTLSEAGKTGVAVREARRLAGKGGVKPGMKGGLSDDESPAYAIHNQTHKGFNKTPTPLSVDNVDRIGDKKKDGFERPGSARYDIAQALTGAGLDKAKKLCRDLNVDFYKMAQVYNDGIPGRRKPPKVPDYAFTAWLVSYCKAGAEAV